MMVIIIHQWPTHHLMEIELNSNLFWSNINENNNAEYNPLKKSSNAVFTDSEKAIYLKTKQNNKKIYCLRNFLGNLFIGDSFIQNKLKGLDNKNEKEIIILNKGNNGRFESKKDILKKIEKL